MRIQWTRLTVKALQKRLQQAYSTGDKRLIRRLSVLLAVGQHKAKVIEVAQQWQLSSAIVYQWLHDFLVERLGSLPYRWGRGRKSKLTASQKRRLCQLLDKGPVAYGFTCGCWSSVLVAELIEQEFGVVYNRFYVCTLLKNLGYSFQKAQFVSGHLDEEKRQAWLEEVWPRLLREAKRKKALILFVDEASFAQWGSLSYTWARWGHTPLVKTSGKRKAYKVFGAIEFFSGRLFYQGIEGRFNGQSYQEFVRFVLGQTEKTKQHLFWIQDGARYHTCASTQQFFEERRQRITVWQLPSYSPDYNPIEYLWRNTKKEATHNKYFAQFEQLTQAVEKTLADFAGASRQVLGLFGRYCKETNLLPQQLKLAA
jgi:transposase